MKNITKIIAIGISAFAGNSFAHSFNLNLNLGASFSRLSNSPYVSPSAGLTNSYQSNEPTQTNFFIGGGAEYDFNQFATAPLTLGLDASVDDIDLGAVQGVEVPNVTAGFTDTLNYSLRSKSIALLFGPKLIDSACRFQPYIFGGVGASWNTLSNFGESLVTGSGAAVSPYPYTNQTNVGFAYDAGAGVQYALIKTPRNNTLFVRLEGQYINLGMSQLGPTAIQNTNSRFTINPTTTVLVNCGLTYQFH